MMLYNAHEIAVVDNALKRCTPRALSAVEMPASEGLIAEFTSETLCSGEPGATDRSHSDLPTINEPTRTELPALPHLTSGHTVHGNKTRISNRATILDERITRGH